MHKALRWLRTTLAEKQRMTEERDALLSACNVAYYFQINDRGTIAEQLELEATVAMQFPCVYIYCVNRRCLYALGDAFFASEMQTLFQLISKYNCIDELVFLMVAGFLFWNFAQNVIKMECRVRQRGSATSGAKAPNFGNGYFNQFKEKKCFCAKGFYPRGPICSGNLFKCLT